jgi:osmoprotectant transport system ATP-binding protein
LISSHPIIFKEVSHYYDTRAFLSEINLSFEAKSITAIIGKSGSGKSTILQMINGLIRPTQGDIYLFGKKIDYKEIYKLRLDIGYTIQGSGLFPHLTVYENIELLAKVNNYDKDYLKVRIDQLMQIVDLSYQYKSKYPYQLSGGEQQRVGICRAMVLNPEIFILDEPFGALDPTTRNEIHRELLALQEAEPRTIVMVTHDISEALKLAQKIVILNDGCVEQYAQKDEIYKNPASEFVSKFLSNKD